MSSYPILLLDGHGSRFDFRFLEYINNPRHHWWTYFGTPYGTNKWHVGNSVQQNGVFNMETSKGEKERLADKVKNYFPFKLTKDDIMWLLCRAWPTSVGRIETNKDAIVESGWAPLN
jgi:hypothetical protein